MTIHCLSLQRNGLRHRVVTRVFMKWMTPCDALQRVPSALPCTMFFNGFFRILRARRKKAAAVERKNWREKQLIQSDEGNEQASHGFSERCGRSSFRRSTIAWSIVACEPGARDSRPRTRNIKTTLMACVAGVNGFVRMALFFR